MLNRKLTADDLGKEFSCNYAGTTIAVTLLCVEDNRLPYCFGLLNPQEELGSAINYWTDSKGRSAVMPASIVISEIEEPEEFRLTGKEVWKAADPEHEKQLDEALGLTEIKLKIPTAVLGVLEAEAKQKGVITKASIREILVKHAAALISIQDN